MGTNLKAVANTVQSYLSTVQADVNAIIDPTTGQPVQIPNFDILFNAAGQLDLTPYPADTLTVIQALLGRASSVDMDVPSPTQPLGFPADHHLHPTMGQEWYWIGAHMNVSDQSGRTGRLSLLLVMNKGRAVGKAAQKAADWSDHEVCVFSNTVTLTIDMGPGERRIVRRSRNLQWALKGGTVGFSSPGQNFQMQCGPDILSGTDNVLPLLVSVADGNNMGVELTLTNQPALDVSSAFFLQGIPASSGNGGTGITSAPTPGLYYSWPQLAVTGTISAQGETYTVLSGSAWVDHQLMMSSLQNANAAPQPVPFVDDPTPFNGWVWQYFNLNENLQAFTGAAFILGAMTDRPAMDYGYFLTPNGVGGWTAIFINGDIDLLYPNALPAIAGCPDSPPVIYPTVRAYRQVENALLGDPLSGVATPWYGDGTFNNPNWTSCAEFPADYTDLSGKYSNGVGYLESVGLQPVAAYRAFALNFLQNVTTPGPLQAETLAGMLYRRR